MRRRRRGNLLLKKWENVKISKFYANCRLLLLPVGMPSSFDPLPNPLTTSPSTKMGSGSIAKAHTGNVGSYTLAINFFQNKCSFMKLSVVCRVSTAHVCQIDYCIGGVCVNLPYLSPVWAFCDFVVDAILGDLQNCRFQQSRIIIILRPESRSYDPYSNPCGKRLGSGPTGDIGHFVQSIVCTSHPAATVSHSFFS